MCACTRKKDKLAIQAAASEPQPMNSRLINCDARKLREGYRHDLREGINE